MKRSAWIDRPDDDGDGGEGCFCCGLVEPLLIEPLVSFTILEEEADMK